MNREGRPRSPEEPSSAATARAENNAMKNEETMQSYHQQQNMLAEAIALLPQVSQNVSAITLFHQLPILYQQHYQHMFQYLQESLRLQNAVNFLDKPQILAVSHVTSAVYARKCLPASSNRPPPTPHTHTAVFHWRRKSP